MFPWLIQMFHINFGIAINLLINQVSNILLVTTETESFALFATNKTNVCIVFRLSCYKIDIHFIHFVHECKRINDISN